MELAAYLVWALEDTRGRTVKFMGEVTQEEFRWRPGPNCNSIGSMAIHIGKVEDVVSGRPLGFAATVWQSGGWAKKLGVAEDDWGWGFDKLTPAAQVTPQAVLEYLNAVHARVIPAIKALTPAKLDEEVKGRTPRTVSQALWTLATEELQHLGQMDYLRGMKRNLGGAMPK